MNAKEKIEKVILHVEELSRQNFGKASAISERVALNMYMGHRELSDVFKFFTGCSLTEYAKERKMMAAYECILTQNEFNVEDAIALSGLENQSSFGKKFKEVFGVTPQEAFYEKDAKKYVSPLTWDQMASASGHQDDNTSQADDKEVFFGVTKDQYQKIVQAQEYKALYDLTDAQSSVAFKIAEADNVAIKEAFSFVEDYLHYKECINAKYDENKELEFLLSLSSKKLKEIYFSVAESISEAMDIIDTAKENDYSLTKKHIEYLSVYCKDPHCYFDEFLQHVEKFEELNGDDFEGYWEMIYVWGFSPEDAVKGFADSINIDVYMEEPDEVFERWASEQTDYINQEKIDIDFDEDNPDY